MPRLIDRYDAVLLDTGGTFVFDHDRFAPAEEFLASYRAAGGRMADGVATSLLDGVLCLMETLTARPHRCRRIDPLSVVLASLAPGLAHRDGELRAFETAVAHCERGTVPPAHGRALRRLAASHRLGLVADIRATPALIEDALETAGLLSLFDTRVWSSRLGAAKPALETYEAALEDLALPPERVLFIGDDPLRDVHGPKTLGLGALWLAAPGTPYPADLLPPDAWAPCLTAVPDLAEASLSPA